MTQANVHFEKARETLAAWAKSPRTRPAVSEKFECHIFFEPMEPDPDVKQRFVEACGRAGVKALCIGLDFEEGGVVNVLQTSTYYQSENPQKPLELMLRDAETLCQGCYVPIRLKLEAIAENPGVPRTNDEMNRHKELTGTDPYFEYHVRFAGPPTEENDTVLKNLARELTEELGVKVPFSCNNMPPKNQRFLNARTYGVGYDESRQVPLRLAEAAGKHGFEVQKIIEEFSVFDSNTELDHGWLEF